MSIRTNVTGVIEVKGLKKHFAVKTGMVFGKVKGWIKAIDGVDFTIYGGETFGIVGESGCGKTTIAKMILLLEKPTAGAILFEGKDIKSLKGSDFIHYRQSIQAVFQDPFSSLDPRMRAVDIVSEPMIATYHLPKNVIKEKVAEVFEQVGLRPTVTSLYPHEFSGGQRQRLAIARALVAHPKCVILDEPVSALDISIRSQVLNLLKDLQTKLGFAYLIISHDLAAVKWMSDRVGVMYLGKLVEVADSEELYSKPLHPYTQALLSAALPSHPDIERREIVLRGEVPSSLNPPSGCRFHPRCQHVKHFCSETEPPLVEVNNNHHVACHLCTQRSQSASSSGLLSDAF